MEKNIIGSWGADLDDSDYPKAIAALGALEAQGTQKHTPSNDPEVLRDALREEFVGGEKTVVWRNAYNPSGGRPILTRWQNPIHKDAQALSEAWRLYLDSTRHHPRLMPRLAVEAAWQKWPELVDLDNLFDVLSYSGVGSLSLLPQDKYGRDLYPDWHWPVRVGVPAGPDGERLFEQFQAASEGWSDWVAELAHVTRVGAVRDNCDLLILPPGWAEELAGRPNVRLRASFVVCLDNPLSWSEAARSAILDEARKKTGAAGIAIVGHRNGSDLRDWYHELIQELSHDIPLHAALWEAGRNWGVMPIVSGFPNYLDRLRILSVAEQLDRQWASLLSSGKVWRWWWRWWSVRGAKDLAPRLADKVREGEFNSESEYGLPTAEDFAKVGRFMEGIRQPRWIQAGIARPDSDSSAFTAGALAAEQPNLVAVFIGPTLEERTDRPFPDREFDFNDGPILLNVQFELANASITALRSTSLGDLLKFGIIRSDDFSQDLRDYATSANAPEPLVEERSLFEVATETIALPAIGTSKPAYFVVWPQAGAAKVKGRIAIIHNNRIAQTAKFEAPVGLETTPANLLVQTEQVQFSRLEDLPKRRGFDLTVMVADDLGNTLNVTTSRNGTAESVSLGSMDKELELMRETIFSATDRAGSVVDIVKDKNMSSGLIFLAANGALLYNLLKESPNSIISDLNANGTEHRIHLLSSTRRFFPLEFIYSGPNPDLESDPKVCENAVDALERGSCGACPNQMSEEFVCPIHFWGWKHIIERHAKANGGDADLNNRAVPTRTPFGPVEPVLFAASEIAFKFESDDPYYEEGVREKEGLESALSTLAGHPVADIDSWKAWRACIKAQPDTKLFLLLTHVNTFNNLEVLEIGQGKRLGKNGIVGGLLGNSGTPKLLILIGCETADVTNTLAPYHELFQNQAGASVIVSSLASILGRDAVPIAREIVNELSVIRTAAESEIALGELMRRIRRTLLAKGHGGILGILCFGDADWVFGGQ